MTYFDIQGDPHKTNQISAANAICWCPMQPALCDIGVIKLRDIDEKSAEKNRLNIR